MNYTMEVIGRAAKNLAEMMRSAVTAELESGAETPRIAEIETDMRELVRQIGRQALGLFLEAMQPTPENEIPCSCGGVLRYQRMREATVISVFGKVTYQRAYYAGCTCHKGKAPLDQQFGLEPGAVTAGLANLLSLAGIGHSYDESPKWLQSFLLFDVAANTVLSETETLGKLQEEHETILINQSQDEAYLQERLRNPGPIPKQLYCEIDAAKVRIEPRPKKGEEKGEHEDWRDMKVLCWFETEEVRPRQYSKRQQEKARREEEVWRAKNKRYACDITEAEEFGKLLWATGCTVNADLCPDLICLGDGAIWIWNLCDRYYPQAVQIVDWHHAEEHLEGLARTAFSAKNQQKVWLEEAVQALWEGRVEEVITACETLKTTCQPAAQEAAYFRRNMERMRYDRFRAAGYMIGSGTIESACKQIVTHRLKLSGAQWTVDGAIYTAKARAAWLSDQWHSLCARRSALPLAV